MAVAARSSFTICTTTICTTAPHFARGQQDRSALFPVTDGASQPPRGRRVRPPPAGCAALTGLQREVFPEQGQGSGGTGRQSTMGCLNLRTFPSRLLHGAMLDIDRGIHDLPTFIAQRQCSSWDPRGVNLY
jgi:hypothetical protein